MFEDITVTQVVIVIIILLMLLTVVYITGMAKHVGFFAQKQGSGVSKFGSETLKQAEEFALKYNINFFVEKKIDLRKVLYKEEIDKLLADIPELQNTDLVCNVGERVYTSDEFIFIENMKLNKLYCTRIEPSKCVWCKRGFQFQALDFASLNKNCCDISKLLMENIGLRPFLLYIVYPTENRIYMALIDVNGDVFLTTIDWDLQNRAVTAYEQRTYFDNINTLYLRIAPSWSRFSLKRLVFYVKDAGVTMFVDKFERNPVKKYEGSNFNAECAGEKINIRIYSKRVNVKVFSAVRITDDFKIKYSATVYIMNSLDT